MQAPRNSLEGFVLFCLEVGTHFLVIQSIILDNPQVV